MRHFAAVALSGLLASTMLIGCKEESKKSSSTETQKAAVKQPGAYEQVPPSNANLSLGQNCYYDLCRNTIEQVPNILLTIQKGVTPSPAQEEYYKSYIEPRMKTVVQALMQTQSLFLQTLEQKESRFSQATLNDIQMRLIYFLTLSRDEKNHQAIVDYLNGEYKKLDFAQAFAVFKSIGKFSYFQKLYPTTGLNEAFEKELKIIQGLELQLNAGLGFKLNLVAPNIAEKIKNRQDLFTDEVAELARASNSVRQLAYFAIGEGSKILDQEIATKPLSLSAIMDIYKNSTIKEDIKKNITLATQLPQQCKARFFQSINLYPQKSEIDNFQKLAEQTRKAALSQLSQSDPAYARVSAVKFVYPTTAEENTKAYLRMLSDQQESFAQDMGEIKAMSDSTLFAMAVISSLNGVHSDFDCAKIPSADISDQTIPDDGFLLVSWFSVRNPTVGVSILAHEIGHSVFAYSNSIEVTRQCLKFKKDNSEQYLNEDYADVFAARTNVALQNQFNIKTANYGCALTISPTNTSLLNMDPKDPHSSGMYRAIQIATHSGQVLPDSCQQMIQQGGFQSAGVVCQ